MKIRFFSIFILIISTVLFNCEIEESGDEAGSEIQKAGKADSPSAPLEGEYSFFSPSNGGIAAATIESMIKSAQKTVHIGMYSFTKQSIKQAICEAAQKGVEVKLVFNGDIVKWSQQRSWNKKNGFPLNAPIPKESRNQVLSGTNIGHELEACGAEIKVPNKTMHQKFVIIDGESVMNSSANFSNGAFSQYSENWVFDFANETLAKAFFREFAFLWDYSQDYISDTDVENNTPISEALNFLEMEAVAGTEDITSLFTSFNWTAIEVKEDGSKTEKEYFAAGQKIKVEPNKVEGEQTNALRDAMIEEIGKTVSGDTILLSINHFNIKAIADALVEAMKKGVEVFIEADNQEYKDCYNTSKSAYEMCWKEEWKEMTPYVAQAIMADPILAEKYKADLPIRIKFYSWAPDAHNWRLNHHKFFVINPDNPERAVLITGSFNFSETAEHSNFENTMIYRGADHKDLYQAFKSEFWTLWDLSRETYAPEFGKPFLEDLQNNDGKIALHYSTPVSLSMQEIMELRTTARSLFPDFMPNVSKNKTLNFYDTNSKRFY